jgi:hypothetical protein
LPKIIKETRLDFWILSQIFMFIFISRDRIHAGVQSELLGIGSLPLNYIRGVIIAGDDRDRRRWWFIRREFRTPAT